MWHVAHSVTFSLMFWIGQTSENRVLYHVSPAEPCCAYTLQRASWLLPIVDSGKDEEEEEDPFEGMWCPGMRNVVWQVPPSHADCILQSLAIYSFYFRRVLPPYFHFFFCYIKRFTIDITAPLRHVNIEVTCLDKPSKPRCRQASYEPGMGC